jgi:hypothetical protein
VKLERYAALVMKWQGLQHEVNYCATDVEGAKRLKTEIIEVERQIAAAPWKILNGEIVEKQGAA